MAPTVKKSSKPIFKTTSPFTQTIWPPVSHEDQEIIVELLYNLLSPLGEYQKTHIQPSRGKKRKRVNESLSDLAPPTSAPVIGSHILVGLNSVTRYLETLAALSAPPTVPIREAGDVETNVRSSGGDFEQNPENTTKPLSMIILTHPQPSSSPSHAHIPALLHLASVQTNSAKIPSEPTRLLTLPTSKEAQLASALHIPRVCAIGICDGAPGARGLEEYVRKHVGLTECLWVDEAMKAEWKGPNIQQA